MNLIYVIIYVRAARALAIEKGILSLPEPNKRTLLSDQTMFEMFEMFL